MNLAKNNNQFAGTLTSLAGFKGVSIFLRLTAAPSNRNHGGMASESEGIDSLTDSVHAQFYARTPLVAPEYRIEYPVSPDSVRVKKIVKGRSDC